MKRKKLERRLVVGHASGGRCDWAAVDVALDSSLSTEDVAALLGPDWRLDLSRLPSDMPPYSSESALWLVVASLLDHEMPGPNLRIVSEMYSADHKVVLRGLDRARGTRPPSGRWCDYDPNAGGVTIWECGNNCDEHFDNWPMMRRHLKTVHNIKAPIEPAKSKNH